MTDDLNVPKPRYPRAPRVHVIVTKELIDVSIRKDSSHCMIAEAVKHARPTAENVSVDLQSIRFSERKRELRYVYLTPRVAQRALIDFDQGDPVMPFEFWLEDASVHRMALRRKPPTLRAEPDQEAVEAYEKEADSEMRSTSTKEPSNRRSEAAQGRLAIPPVTGSVLRSVGTVQGSYAVAHNRRVGGRPPPSGTLARERAFGLRLLKR